MIRVCFCCWLSVCLPATRAVADPGLAPGPALAQAAAPAPVAGAMTLNLDVIARALDVAREQIEPSLGASTYKFTRPAIEDQPQGDNTAFNQLILQAPSVSQDSFGQL